MFAILNLISAASVIIPDISKEDCLSEISHVENLLKEAQKAVHMEEIRIEQLLVKDPEYIYLIETKESYKQSEKRIIRELDRESCLHRKRRMRSFLGEIVNALKQNQKDTERFERSFRVENSGKLRSLMCKVTEIEETRNSCINFYKQLLQRNA